MRASSDVGGTFTDLVYYTVDPVTGKCGEVLTAKADTTPPDFEQGVLNALAKSGVSISEIDFFAHGSTVVINALTERKGVKTALITTKGFRDVLEIARGNRPDLFNFNFRKPKPFVERYLRAELEERVTFRGDIKLPVNLAPLENILKQFRDDGVQAIAVSFLHAYVEAANEIKVVREIERLWPEVSVLASHEVSREWREYERTNTTVLSAYVHPITEKYINNLEQQLVENGFSNPLYIMQSNGGIATAEAARANPIAMVESGPASGIFAAAYMGRLINQPNLIVLDIGGTTAKCTLVEGGEVKVTTEYHIERDGKSPGYPIQTAVSEIVEIGNGGGSIASIDEGGKLHVGPKSAGARPGPAAYGYGGTHATTTDANLVLGRIDPASFVGGEREPDWNAVDAAFAPLQEKLDLSKAEVARGIVRIANANMTGALRLVSTNKGYDPRSFALMAFGGGGAMHAVALAEELRVPHVIVPANSSVFSAWGMLLTDLRQDYLQTNLTSLTVNETTGIAETFKIMEHTALADYGRDDVQFERLLDMRYLGQEHTVKIPEVLGANGDIDVAATGEAFHAAHEKRFTYRLDNAIEIVNFHLVASVAVEKPELAEKQPTGRSLDDVRMGTRQVDFDQHGVHDAQIYNGLLLESGMEFRGPAIIQEPSVTCVVPPPHKVTIDPFGNYHIHLHY